MSEKVSKGLFRLILCVRESCIYFSGPENDSVVVLGPT